MSKESLNREIRQVINAEIARCADDAMGREYKLAVENVWNCIEPILMGDAAIRKDAEREFEPSTLVNLPDRPSLSKDTLSEVTEEKLVEDIAADICDTVSHLNGIAYTPAQWMGTARNALKHFKYHSQREIPVIDGTKLYDLLRKEVEHQTGADETAERLREVVWPYLKREAQPSEIPVISKEWCINMAKLEGEMTMKPTEEMISRFLQWKLPANFRPDCGIIFDADAAKKLNPNNARYEPVGTNLFDYEQARQMLEFVLETTQPVREMGDLVESKGLVALRALKELYDAVNNPPMHHIGHTFTLDDAMIKAKTLIEVAETK